MDTVGKIMLLLIGVMILCAILFFTPRMEITYNYKYYECDGEVLDDECSYSKIVRSGVHISNCKSGNEYFCKTAKEFVDKPTQTSEEVNK